MSLFPPIAVRCCLLGLLGALIVSSTGCGIVLAPWLGPRGATLPAKEAVPNPLFVPIVDRELLWNQLVDELDDYFRIAREQRVQDSGGVLTEGRIDTYPTVGATALEPWRRDSTPGFERLEATLQSIRRRCTARVIPREGGYFVEVQVLKELEDVSQPERSTVVGPTQRHDGSLVRGETDTQTGPQTLGWICIGRDVSLEQQILTELMARLK
ncbi:MAG: hypothetical protein U0935_20575 [Pirellulales bacterium]